MIHISSFVVGSYCHIGNFTFLNFGPLHLVFFIFYYCLIKGGKVRPARRADNLVVIC
jgi:hypothetical protein